VIKAILVRYGIPSLLAVFIIAYLGIPIVNQLLAGWFRNDVELRAQLIANTIGEPLGALVQKNDRTSLRSYLAKLTTDERLLAALVCGTDGTLIYKTDAAPAYLNCSNSADMESKKKKTYTLELPSGAVAVSQFDFAPVDATPYRLVLIHDLSYVDRRQSTARNYVIAALGLFVTMLALLAGFATWLLIRRWVNVLVGDIRGLRFLDDAESALVAQPVLKQVREVLREIERNQRLEIDFKENWTPLALQQIVREYMGSPEMFIISNREPYIHNQSPNGPIVQVPASGMVTALEPIVRACAGTWIAHGSGSADREVVDKRDHVRVPPEEPAYTLRRVWLSEQEEEGFYYGFSNEGMWPLCHLTYVRPAFRESDWQQYQQVNRKFAAALAEESSSANPVVLIQDYHFALLPKMIRKQKPSATIALFWHIPWPNEETIGICPWKEELLLHMLAADILGFHTRYHCQNFLNTVDRFVECQIDHEHMTITLQGHVCRVAPYPISIEWPPRWLAHLPPAPQSREAVRTRYGIARDAALGLGVERWDFTKGIIERFHALEYMLDNDRSMLGKVTLLQVAAPSRSKLPAYHALQEQTLSEVVRINEKFSVADWKPIVLIDQHQEPAQVFELYRAADFCLVNSLHDGMNLVAKEFVAARDDEDGVLILSTFAGASRELSEALLVNPYDVGQTAQAIKSAIQMSREERRQRMKLMRRIVKENNVYRWAGRMLMTAATIRQRQALSEMSASLR
jgi:trehalose-6-phosphate synthase